MPTFAMKYTRLKDAVETRQRGIAEDKRLINVEDLSDLLFHFDRIDKEIRATHPQVLQAENKKLHEALKEFIAEVRLGVRYGDHVIPQAITKVDEVLLQLLDVRGSEDNG